MSPSDPPWLWQEYMGHRSNGRHPGHVQLLLHFCLVYKVQISLVKISVCLFLLQIFEWTAFCYISYTVIALNAAIEITWMFLDSFQCIPVHLAMD
ncbi:hypothetical protein MAP00_001047 [Monascus purpureus]|nr:hypothetical protein MAP00_001047 [Monascus purpureus]